MNRLSYPIKSFALIAVVYLTSACAQDPAHVALKGSSLYGTNGTQRQSLFSDENYTYVTPRLTNGYTSFDNRSHATAPAQYSYNTEPQSSDNHYAQQTPYYQPSASMQSVSSADLPPVGQPQYKVPAYSQPAPQSTPQAVREPVLMPRFDQYQPKPRASYTPAKPQAMTNTSSRNKSYIQPTQGNIVSRFGEQRGGQMNEGISIAAAAGEPVYAARKGTVAYTGDQIRNYGNMVIVKHGSNRNTSYAHLARITVAQGTVVEQGQVIGYVGQTGNVSSPQLHFAIREGSVAIDPTPLLDKSVASVY